MSIVKKGNEWTKTSPEQKPLFSLSLLDIWPKKTFLDIRPKTTLPNQVARGTHAAKSKNILGIIGIMLAIRIYVVMSHMAVVIDPAIERQPVWVVVGPAEYESNAMAM